MIQKPIKFIIIQLLLLISLPCSLAATIHGNIYDISLNLVNEVIITVDSVPKQSIVVKEGKYSLDLLPGSYTLNFSTIDKKYSTKEMIFIDQEGDYIYDVILFPDLSDENELLDEDINIEVPDLKPYDGINWIILSLFSIAFVFFFLFVYLFRKRIIKDSISKDSNSLPDDLKPQVLDFIRKKGLRTTQKEIRKNFAFSEAKISLIISELESERKIKKIKKGRGNIIVLNE